MTMYQSSLEFSVAIVVLAVMAVICLIPFSFFARGASKASTPSKRGG